MDSRTQPKTLFCLFTILILGFVASLPVTIDAAGQLGDDDDHGDDPAHATPIALDTPVNGVIGFTNDVDYFSFEANQGNQIRIETTGEGSNLRTVVSLIFRKRLRNSGVGCIISRRTSSGGTYVPPYSDIRTDRRRAAAYLLAAADAH